MVVYRVKDARSINNGEEETSKVRAKVTSSFLLWFVNLEKTLDYNSASMKIQFSLNAFGSFFDKVIGFSLQHSSIPETGSITEPRRNFVGGT